MSPHNLSDATLVSVLLHHFSAAKLKAHGVEMARLDIYYLTSTASSSGLVTEKLGSHLIA